MNTVRGLGENRTKRENPSKREVVLKVSNKTMKNKKKSKTNSDYSND